MPKSRPFPAAVAAAALGLAWLAGCAPAAPPAERSVVVITMDTTRADRLGAYGNRGGLTPNLDRLAREGSVFDEAISQVPLTLPSHASMFTGRYPATHGVRHNGIYRLRETETTLAERLKERGWETAAFVSAFVLNRGFGIEQGFDVFDDVPVNRYEGGRDQVYEAERRALDVNKRVAAWLSARPDPKRKFFLWVHYYDPHDPYDAPELADRKLPGEGYDREVAYMDAAIGDLLGRLERAGVLESAIVMAVSDHGEALGEHGERTHGVFLYEPVVHVPWIVRAPGLVDAGARVKGPVELVDLAPTVLDLVGQPALEAAQGRSLLPRLSGSDDGVGRVAYAESLEPRLEFGWSELRMARDSNFKYVQAPQPELYDLRSDRAESNNLAGNDPERAQEMAGLLAAWESSTTDASAQADASRKLDPEEEAKLRSLGYLGGDFFKTGGEGSRLDPKEGIKEVRRLESARAKLAAGEAASALAEIDAILKANPRNHIARSTRVNALLETGDPARAEEEALAALAAAETDTEASAVLRNQARGLLAAVLQAQGKIAEAEQQYLKVLRDDPADGAAAADLSRMLFLHGRFDEARRRVDAALAADPANGMVLATRFLLERRRGDAAAAFATAKALADLRSGDAPALVEAGGLLSEHGDHARAAACYEVALGQSRDLDARLLGRLGTARLAAGNPAGAAEAFHAAAYLDPRDPRPHHYLGVIALQRGDEKEARASFDRALAIDPGFSASPTSLGRWLASQGRKDEAALAFEDAVRRNPRDRGAAEALSGVRAP
ncbi:MAG TPA: sulfatase-like hydrolase/transferase [Candidatus Polarisedimenticolaceae bacterium]